jgi:hypothetical protein
MPIPFLSRPEHPQADWGRIPSWDSRSNSEASPRPWVGYSWRRSKHATKSETAPGPESGTATARILCETMCRICASGLRAAIWHAATASARPEDGKDGGAPAPQSLASSCRTIPYPPAPPHPWEIERIFITDISKCASTTISNAVMTSEASRRWIGTAGPGNGMRSVVGPLEAKNPRDRAKRRCRWLAYHACRARSLVRLVLVASTVGPPGALRDTE